MLLILYFKRKRTQCELRTIDQLEYCHSCTKCLPMLFEIVLNEKDNNQEKGFHSGFITTLHIDVSNEFMERTDEESMLHLGFVDFEARNHQNQCLCYHFETKVAVARL